MRSPIGWATTNPTAQETLTYPVRQGTLATDAMPGHRLHRHQAGFCLRVHADLLTVIIRRKGQCDSDLALCLGGGVGVHDVRHDPLNLIVCDLGNRAHRHLQHTLFVYDYLSSSTSSKSASTTSSALPCAAFGSCCWAAC